jgi:hypothetical protein
MVSGMVNGGNLANGWHHFDEDSNMSMESGGSPDRKKKRKLSSDSDEAMRRSKLARILLEEGKHGLIDGRWVCGQCGKSLSSASGLDQHIQTVHGAYCFPVTIVI